MFTHASENNRVEALKLDGAGMHRIVSSSVGVKCLTCHFGVASTCTDISSFIRNPDARLNCLITSLDMDLSRTNNDKRLPLLVTSLKSNSNLKELIGCR
jgi:hypothetical protein